jgi:hypothetical protein
VTKGFFNQDIAAWHSMKHLIPPIVGRRLTSLEQESTFPSYASKKAASSGRRRQADSGQHDALERVLQSFGSSAPWASKKSWVWGRRTDSQRRHCCILRLCSSPSSRAVSNARFRRRPVLFRVQNAFRTDYGGQAEMGRRHSIPHSVARGFSPESTVNR